MMKPTVGDVVIWADDVALSSGQMQKAYDWRIAQWATLSNAILTAIFVLIGSALVEIYKRSLQLPHFGWLAGGTVAVYVLCYGFCRWKIRRLRQEFLALYTLLLEIA